MLNKLFVSADKYIEQSSWKDFAVLKFCLFSLGLLVGVYVPDKYIKIAAIIAAIVFVVTYIPLMAKYIKIFCQKEDTDA